MIESAWKGENVSGQTAMTPADIFVAMQSSENTKRAYKNDIKKWYQFVDTVGGGETEENAVGFKQALENIYAPATAQRVWCTVAAFYGWMKGTGKIEATPFHGIKSPTRPSGEAPPVPSDDDIAKLLRSCDNGTKYGERARLIISLLLNGLRAQEVCDLKKTSIKRDKTNQQWIINVLGKGEKWRAVPLISEAQESIFDFYLNYKADSEWLVPSLEVGGSKINVKSVWTNVSFFAKKAGVENVHPHALRHHYATRLVRAGVDIFTLQKLMGHARADTTQRYVGLDYSDLNKAVLLDPLHNPLATHKHLFFGMEELDESPVPF